MFPWLRRVTAKKGGSSSATQAIVTETYAIRLLIDISLIVEYQKCSCRRSPYTVFFTGDFFGESDSGIKPVLLY